MEKEIKIIEVDVLDRQLLVGFSDNTRALYTVEDLLQMRPYRSRSDEEQERKVG